MKYFFITLGIYGFSHSQAKPPKSSEPTRVAFTYPSNEKLYRDTTAYIFYLDSTIRTKKFCFTDDTLNIISGETADVPPQFPGGNVKLLIYLMKTIMYPSLPREKNIQGKVIARIIINEDGEICNPKIIKRLGFWLDEESIRVIELMPRWSPASKNGTPVKSYVDLPVTYKLL
jgi:TonB family protein